MNYNQLIINWHVKASDDDFFSKFVFEYLAFIAFLKKKKFTNSQNDRAAIQFLKQDESIKIKYLNKVLNNVDLHLSWEEIKKELKIARLGNVSGNSGNVEEIKWWNCSHSDLGGHAIDDKNKVKGYIYNLEDWENMVEFWYSIRNNLFHGAKNPEDRRDRLFVEHGYKTLNPLVQILLETE
ncbi:MAG: hypothetical protein PHT44_02375 [Candidatus Portnoybacteria bacterium]|nr:hypothetical protein [Candidatus Portnoybacteria bacterium]MDD4982387.1 hypothetical protein [Candidatus Portnoybacteria bacterium]